jgi:hypothetical protein
VERLRRRFLQVPERRGTTDDLFVGDQVTRRSRSSILIYLSRSPIQLCSKKQNTIETCTFGSEFVALKIATELAQGLCYKLDDGPTSAKCDNMLVVQNGTALESMLKKKSSTIAYHAVRQAIAAYA